MDGYDADFVDDVAEYLKCIVCHSVLRNPVLLVDCGHRLCRGCYDKLKTHADQQVMDFFCPLDRIEVDEDQVVEDKGISRVILDLKVKCDHYGEGCQWIGELRNLQTHSVDRCGYEERKETAQLLVELAKRIESCEESLKKKDIRIKSLESELNQTRAELQQIKFEQYQMKDVELKQIKMEQNQMKGTCDELKQFKMEQQQIKGTSDKVVQVEGEENPMPKTVNESKDTNGHGAMTNEEMTGSTIKLDPQGKALQKLNVTEYVPNIHTVYERTLKNYAYYQDVGFAESPKFYSKLNGHCCTLYLHWFGPKKGKLGFYLRIHNDGWMDNDPSPFNMAHTFETVDKHGESRTHHISLEEIHENQENFIVQPGETSSVGYGFNDFLNMPSLTNYIQNDTLFIRCTLFHNPST